MSRIKVDAKQIKRAPLNITIDAEISNAFKPHCKSQGLPANLLVESFMEQFVSGEFVLKIGKVNRIIVDIDEETEQHEYRIY